MLDRIQIQDVGCLCKGADIYSNVKQNMNDFMDDAGCPHVLYYTDETVSVFFLLILN